MRPRLRDSPDGRGHSRAEAAAREVGEPRVLAERRLAAGGADPVRQDQVQKSSPF